MRRCLAISLALFVALVAARGASALEVIGVSDSAVEVERNQAVLVRLDDPVNSVFVADPEIADVQVRSARLIYIFGRGAGETTLFALDSEERVIVSERVRVRHNMSGLQRALATLDPAQPINVEAVDDALVLRGHVSSAEVAENARRIAVQYAGEDNVINRLQVTGPSQVNIRVRVAEVSRSLTENFGVRWDEVSADLFGEVFRFFGGAVSGAEGAFNFDFEITSGNATVDGLIEALAEEGLISILAEPNLTAMSGETASFLAGGEFPIPVSQDRDRVTVEFKEFGVRLEFTPVLLGDDRISLAVAPEVSELNFADGVTVGGFNIPALNTRRASTTVELGSGQSFAIAGLLQNTRDHNISKLPGLGDLPILGALFRSDRFREGETELAIVVTPYVVEPTSTREMALPTDDLLPPNDVERIFFGRMYGESAARRQAAARELEGQELSGSVGFMLE